MSNKLNSVRLQGMLVLCTLLHHINAHLVDPKNYMDRVVERMVHHMENKFLFDKLLPMKDGSSKLNTTRYGITADGDVRFHSGFLMSIDSATISKSSYRSSLSDTGAWLITANFLFNRVSVAYDVHYVFKHQNIGDATFLITFPNLEFLININGNNTERAARGELEFVGDNSGGRGQYDMEVKGHPNTAYVQIIGRNFMLKSEFREAVVSNFEQWGIIFQPALDMAINQIEYPDIDYFK